MIKIAQASYDNAVTTVIEPLPPPRYSTELPIYPVRGACFEDPLSGTDRVQGLTAASNGYNVRKPDELTITGVSLTITLRRLYLGWTRI